ncbi:MAG: tRNA glutamyl-Q(34) synthetase GluQRS [Rhodanobacter sp.]|nr:MAG: tRNA glutamyl-Q(34) synthetase GluQRS [Rhodanobacter sp.]TAM00222.1 MAG: tRNA glutamyl-Q(34) synthetase GluQRS [Rhodanobacter sp.]TAM42025.1 MAG: tRNA glutamyl-Q(34) synthetase GluQRS [Rhodanobacter sp.]TAN25996.1 MAG: tRNA glutamyl-Q(34) synthetase GluQRS [Rhodanobacter sp.]
MTYRGRFAPSPTGQLHFGSLVAAVGSWLYARHAGGQWLLRMEDIDPPREVAGAAADILAALPAFGLVADEPPLFQSQRTAAYDEVFEQLRAAGQVFPCTCSRRQLASNGGIHRDGQCVAADGSARAVAWRLRVPDVEVGFDDAMLGPQRENLRDSVGDFVIRRADGLYSYQLACVVDDAFQHITEVVRGQDLLESTGRQIWLQRCLDLPTPAYRHLPLVLDGEGNKLSKSSRAWPIDPADPTPALRRALSFLGRPLPDMPTDAERLLAHALTDFEPALMPHCSGNSDR